MRMQMIASLLTASVLALGQSPISPIRVVDIRAVIRIATQRQNPSIINVAQNNGRWAVLARFEDTAESVVIGGDDQEVHVSPIGASRPDRIALDANGLVHLRSRTRTGSDIEVKNWAFTTNTVNHIDQTGLEPVSSGQEILWRKGNLGDTVFRFASPNVAVGRLRAAGEKTAYEPLE